MIKKRIKILNSKFEILNSEREGAVLLVVLFVIMAITILSLGFMSRSDVELTCGQNMILRTQMDYLAESGLQHAKGLILNSQDVGSEYWTGATAQQLDQSSSDYYDVQIVRDNNEPNNYCNYIIDCNSYRLKNGEKIGRSSLSAELRLDPCIALWIGTDTTLWPGVVIHGDANCAGTLLNKGTINGDVFAGSLTDDGTITGQEKAVDDLSLAWPQVVVGDFTSNYTTEFITSNSLSGVTLGSCDPVRVCYRIGNLTLAGDVLIEGMLLVEGDLIVQGATNVIKAAKNLPALFVTGDLKVEKGSSLDVKGLAVIDGQMQVSADSDNVNILGGLFVRDILTETALDSSGNENTGLLCNGPTWRPLDGMTGGALEFDGINDKVENFSVPALINGLTAITVSLWVKSDVTFQDRGILFTRDPTGSDEELGIRYDKFGAVGHGINCIKAYIRTTAGYTQIESTSNVQTTSWQHLALVWKIGSSLKLYIDGQLNPLSYDRTPSGLTGTIAGVQKFMLGRGTKGTYWDGLSDDVRIYNYALDPNDIYPPKDGLPGLLLHWRFDEPGSDIVITAAPAKTAIWIWSEDGTQERWGQAAGAFFRSIRRR